MMGNGSGFSEGLQERVRVNTMGFHIQDWTVYMLCPGKSTECRPETTGVSLASAVCVHGEAQQTFLKSNA